MTKSMIIQSMMTNIHTKFKWLLTCVLFVRFLRFRTFSDGFISEILLCTLKPSVTFFVLSIGVPFLEFLGEEHFHDCEDHGYTLPGVSIDPNLIAVEGIMAFQ